MHSIEEIFAFTNRISIISYKQIFCDLFTIRNTVMKRGLFILTDNNIPVGTRAGALKKRICYLLPTFSVTAG